MRQTLRRTASSVSFLLAASALALPVALARGVTEHPPSVTFQSASYSLEAPRESLLASSETLVPLTAFGVYGAGTTLVARLDTRALTVGATSAEQTTVVASESSRYFGVDLPKPNRWSSVLATLALVGFFFLRRIV